ncbi:MAG: GYD domain-containing protein [Rhodospirillales bacterium]
MKYIFVGTLDRQWVGRQKDRVDAAGVKGAELGIAFEAIYYTQGAYDFIDVVEAPDANAVLAFSIWYAKQGYGRITTMPAFDEAAMETAVGMM